MQPRRPWTTIALGLVTVLTFACSSSGEEAPEAEEGALQTQAGTAPLFCKPNGEPCIVGEQGKTCFRQWKIESRSATQARVLETADQGNDVKVVPMWSESKAFARTPGKLDVSWGMFRPYSRIEASGAGPELEGEAHVLNGQTLKVRCSPTE